MISRRTYSNLCKAKALGAGLLGWWFWAVLDFPPALYTCLTLGVVWLLTAWILDDGGVA